MEIFDFASVDKKIGCLIALKPNVFDRDLFQTMQRIFSLKWSPGRYNNGRLYIAVSEISIMKHKVVKLYVNWEIYDCNELPHERKQEFLI